MNRLDMHEHECLACGQMPLFEGAECQGSHTCLNCGRSLGREPFASYERNMGDFDSPTPINFRDKARRRLRDK